jgi:hypothetical protein
VQEWLNWPLSKSGMGQLIEGSNPSLSAIKNSVLRDAIFYRFNLLLYKSHRREADTETDDRACAHIHPVIGPDTGQIARADTDEEESDE